ncbi:hypothetical protein B9Q04_09460 [Candidatus Marsarchaeota G2 archaeon BE_D]|jgi:hypothetical protein|uniref:Uncharacterized protein n=4 Tax=Candidatus Marsarchaeota group 2 TaxID=2203771 RepID=A0A2R6CA38_9ARCH|nr:MAG: hypothetical protein B9Q06_02370 [Candidatus Marsarchaeota G2 archaeon ECH_B_2]PSO01163.1 MAG: hypothetical protein B9Q07_01715 [Candidatus Marsarchaeota G2 archaeon ECH_B_3]PSO02951.1 MAG: hypothetical protein B9Q05_02550 [Candidatus Marsarchaeota G2 archaeon ECH_B_1]PSO07708.1 MAG: hypothetical protein B9Q04_09460 [Candidatus Marsarchaeota G2 archaeon BE_D]
MLRRLNSVGVLDVVVGELRFEFVEFSSAVDFLMGVHAYFSAPGIRPYVPVDQYRGYLLHISAIGDNQDELVVLVFISKSTLPSGIVEFDITTKQFAKVEAFSRPDKIYFLVIEPAYSTLANQAIQAYEAQKDGS